MEAFWNLVHFMIVLDAAAFVLAFAIGVLVAPVVVLRDGALWWKHRLKWTAVALFGSWFGLSMDWRGRRSAAPPPPRSPIASR